MRMRTLAMAAGLAALAGSACAGDLKDLKKKLGAATQPSPDAGTRSDSGSDSTLLGALGGGLALPAISGDTAGNAAGVLEYCARRKYLDGGAVAAVKDKLLGSIGLQDEEKARQDEGYRSGLQGVLQGGDGKSLNLDSISDKVKDRACDYVLDNAASLI
ncbi:MAG: DUF2501 domain-containing protein [Pseudoxanthomonas sp.]